jgi:dihydroorotase
VGIKVRIGAGTSGPLGIEPMRIAMEVAEHAGLPLMTHLDLPPPPRDEVMRRLRRGDIITHCFRPFPNAPAATDGGIYQDVLEARARGVIFDIGHGAGSFGFGTARGMLKAGFLPDAISSDVHITSIDGPAFDLLTTMSKFLCLGVDLATVVKLATVGPAAAIKRPDLGTLKVGSIGDATVIDLASGKFDYTDSIGERLVGDRRLLATGVVLAGRWWHPS